MKNLWQWLLLISLFAVACNDDDTVIENEEELITTLILNFEDASNSNNSASFSFTDLDGDGGMDPVTQSIVLNSNTNYTLTVELLNESEDPAEDIGDEVAEESLEHQLFYQLQGVNANISYRDTDSNNQPLGLEMGFETQQAGSGSLIVTLRHEPDKAASGVAEGDITNAGGETDIEVSFPIQIQ